MDGLLRPAGWTRLPAVRQVTDLLTGSSQIDSIEFEPVYFIHPLAANPGNDPTITDAINDTVNNESKPAVAVINRCHAVTLIRDGVQSSMHMLQNLSLQRGKNYVFKNSYGTNDRHNPAYIRIPTNQPPGLTRNGFRF